MADDDLRRFFEHCFDGNTKGWLCGAVGREPYRDENGKYQHRDWNERAFSWPRRSDEALQYIAETSLLGDVYVCPYPMKQRRRSKGEAAQRILIHADRISTRPRWPDSEGSSSGPAHPVTAMSTYRWRGRSPPPSMKLCVAGWRPLSAATRNTATTTCCVRPEP